MRKARILGNYVQYLAAKQGITEKDLAETLNCTEFRVLEFYKGLAYPSFSQISNLANKFNVSIEELLNGNMDMYNKTVVHCMNDFDSEENREQILDIIENYIDILNSVYSHS